MSDGKLTNIQETVLGENRLVMHTVSSLAELSSTHDCPQIMSSDANSDAKCDANFNTHPQSGSLTTQINETKTDASTCHTSREFNSQTTTSGRSMSFDGSRLSSKCHSGGQLLHIFYAKPYRKLDQFLKRLYTICETSDPSIVGWGPDGKSVVVADSERLAKEIMPQFWKTTRYASFQRQLNFHQFTKVLSQHMSMSDIPACVLKKWDLSVDSSDDPTDAPQETSKESISHHLVDKWHSSLSIDHETDSEEPSNVVINQHGTLPKPSNSNGSEEDDTTHNFTEHSMKWKHLTRSVHIYRHPCFARDQLDKMFDITRRIPWKRQQGSIKRPTLPSLHSTYHLDEMSESQRPTNSFQERTVTTQNSPPEQVYYHSTHEDTLIRAERASDMVPNSVMRWVSYPMYNTPVHVTSNPIQPLQSIQTSRCPNPEYKCISNNSFHTPMYAYANAPQIIQSSPWQSFPVSAPSLRTIPRYTELVPHRVHNTPACTPRFNEHQIAPSPAASTEIMPHPNVGSIETHHGTYFMNTGIYAPHPPAMNPTIGISPNQPNVPQMCASNNHNTVHVGPIAYPVGPAVSVSCMHPSAQSATAEQLDI